jgi:hypothetical protein
MRRRFAGLRRLLERASERVPCIVSYRIVSASSTCRGEVARGWGVWRLSEGLQARQTQAQWPWTDSTDARMSGADTALLCRPVFSLKSSSASLRPRHDWITIGMPSSVRM